MSPWILTEEKQKFKTDIEMILCVCVCDDVGFTQFVPFFSLTFLEVPTLITIVILLTKKKVI